MTPTLEADPDCARPDAQGLTEGPTPAGVRAERRPFDTITRETWDSLAAANPWATPFSAWAFHRAWWDGYGENAHDQTMVVLDGDALLGIVPLMHRHVVDPDDAAIHTTIRHQLGGPALTPVAPTAKAVYFGASYHADYATLLAAPGDLGCVARATVDALGDSRPADPAHPEPWDVIDLRRLRAGDPAADALAEAFGAREVAAGWTLNLEREDVCPVLHLPARGGIDDVLAGLGRKERHEVRRKVRRAEAAGTVELVESDDCLRDLDAFIDLHQRRWGADGLFPDNRGGDQSRRFMRRLFELFDGRSTPNGWSVHLSFLMVGSARVAAAVHFETADALLYYNAGVDPEARTLSPGVVLLERLVRRALERGKTRLDLLRGDESYKYEWGAVDEPIQRLLVRRTATR